MRYSRYYRLYAYACERESVVYGVYTLDSQFGDAALACAHHVLHDALVVSLVEWPNIAD